MDNRWNDPEVRARRVAAANNPELKAARAARMKALWADPEWRARTSASIARAAKQRSK